MKKILYFLLISLWVFACGPAPQEQITEDSTPIEDVSESEVEVPEFVAKIEKAHQKAAFLQKEAIAFDIELFFGG
ncbi:MAG: hypothetical protein AAFU64_15660, partial [Bacteroidota bacterium]